MTLKTITIHVCCVQDTKQRKACQCFCVCERCVVGFSGIAHDSQNLEILSSKEDIMCAELCQVKMRTSILTRPLGTWRSGQTRQKLHWSFLWSMFTHLLLIHIWFLPNRRSARSLPLSPCVAPATSSSWFSGEASFRLLPIWFGS